MRVGYLVFLVYFFIIGLVIRCFITVEIKISSFATNSVDWLDRPVDWYRKEFADPSTLSGYWNNLKSKMHAFGHLRRNYDLKKFKIDNKNYFIELSSLFPLTGKNLQEITGQPKMNLEQLFANKVTNAKINMELKRLEHEEKAKLWYVLVKHQQTILTLVQKGDLGNQMIIDLLDYQRIFRELVEEINRQGKTFETLSETEGKRLVWLFFLNGTNASKVDALLTKLQTTEIKKVASGKNMLAIGLGIGIGIMSLAIVGILGYWFLPIRQS